MLGEPCMSCVWVLVSGRGPSVCHKMCGCIDSPYSCLPPCMHELTLPSTSTSMHACRLVSNELPTGASPLRARMVTGF